MLILSFGCLRFLRESCLLYAFLLGYLPSIFLTFSAKPIDFYLQDCLQRNFFGQKTSCTDWGANQCRKFIVLDIGQHRTIPA